MNFLIFVIVQLMTANSVLSILKTFKKNVLLDEIKKGKFIKYWEIEKLDFNNLKKSSLISILCMTFSILLPFLNVIIAAICTKIIRNNISKDDSFFDSVKVDLDEEVVLRFETLSNQERFDQLGALEVIVKVQDDILQSISEVVDNKCYSKNDGSEIIELDRPITPLAYTIEEVEYLSYAFDIPYTIGTIDGVKVALLGEELEGDIFVKRYEEVYPFQPIEDPGDSTFVVYPVNILKEDFQNVERVVEEIKKRRKNESTSYDSGINRIEQFENKPKILKKIR